MMPRSINPLMLLLLLPCTSAWALEGASPSAGKVSAALLKRDTALCVKQADIDACYDALRWQPSDPALLVGLGDALLRANRPGDALRNYRRAAEIAPATRGLAAKISATDAKLHAKHTARILPPEHPPVGEVAPKHYSNAAPESQSH